MFMRADQGSMDFSDFLEQSEGATSPGELFDLLVRAGRSVGFGRVAYLALRGDHPLVRHSKLPWPFVETNFPAHWLTSYTARREHEEDPVLRYVAVYQYPFRWEELTRSHHPGNGASHLCARAAREKGQRGVTVPIHGPNRRLAAICFASEDHGPAKEALGWFQAVAIQYYRRAADLDMIEAATDALPDLTERQLECLRLVAEGKSSWDIGTILGISSVTATYHIKNAMRKLSTGSRTVAAIKAIELGLLDPPRLIEGEEQELR